MNEPCCPPPPAPPVPAKQRGGGYWLAWVAGLLLAGSILVNGVLLLMVGIMALTGGSGDHAPDETVVRSGSGAQVIVEIELDGVITEQREEDLFGSHPSLVERIRSQLETAAQDERAAAVVLSLDTPGGGVTASDRLHHLVNTFRTEYDIPVYAHMGGICASGGYYVAMACDEVVAAPTTITGSIGVIISLLNAEKLLVERIGVTAVPITSGRHKDMGSPWRALETEERAILQSIVDSMYHRFIDIIIANRRHAPAFVDLDEGVLREHILALADGRILHADQALDDGLIDAITYREDLYDRIASDLGLSDPSVIRYHTRPGGLAGLLSSRAPDLTGADARLATRLNAALSPRFEYRWLPHAQP